MLLNHSIWPQKARERWVRVLVVVCAMLFADQAQAQPSFPSDLNQASLRVQAMDTIYEFDLSSDQLKDFRIAANGSASQQQRTPAKGTPKLIQALREFSNALAEGKDDNRISSARVAMMQLLDDDNVHLDDEVSVSAASRSKAARMAAQLKASQIAAFLASHADEITDPVELMMSTIEELKEIKNGEGKPEDAPGIIQDNAQTVAMLVAGTDEAKAKPLVDQVSQWMKSKSESSSDSPAEKRALEDSAKKIVGDVAAMKVLSNWLEYTVARLLSNPQLPSAIETMQLAHRGE